MFICSRRLAGLSLACLLFCVIRAQAQIPQIPTDPNILTEPQYVARTLRPLYQRILFDAYQQLGQHNEKWDAQVRELFDWYITLKTDEALANDLIDWSACKQAHKAFVKSGCDDPLAWVIAEHLEYLMHRRNPPKRAADYARQLDEAGRYHPLILAETAMIAWQVRNAYRVPQEAEEFQRRALNRYLQALRMPEHHNDDQRVLLQSMRYWAINNFRQSEAQWKQYQQFMETVKSDQKIEPWTRHVLLGRSHEAAGWRVRGGGYANTVKPEAWPIFQREMREAGRHARSAVEINPDRPEPSQILISVCGSRNGKPDESELYWLQRAITAQVDWIPAYTGFGWYMRPRWGGSEAKLAGLATACAVAERYDTSLPALYLKLVNDIDDEFKHQHEALRQTGLYTRAVRVLDRMIQTPRWEKQIRALHIRRAQYAWLDRQYDIARQELTQAEPVMTDYAKRYSIVGCGEFYYSSFARGGPHGDQVLEADRLFDQKRLGEADAKYQAILPLLAGDAPAEHYVRHRLKVIEIEQAFNTGQWVDLTFDKNQTGWLPTRGQWKILSPTEVQGIEMFTMHSPQLICMARTGHRLEYTGEVEHHAWCSAPMFCYATSPLWRFRSLFMSDKWDTAGLRRDLYYGSLIQNVPIDKVSTFRIEVFDRATALWVNDKLIQTIHWLKPDEPYGNDEYIGVTTHDDHTGIKGRFRNLRIRKLTEPPDSLKALLNAP